MFIFYFFSRSRYLQDRGADLHQIFREDGKSDTASRRSGGLQYLCPRRPMGRGIRPHLRKAQSTRHPLTERYRLAVCISTENDLFEFARGRVGFLSRRRYSSWISFPARGLYGTFCVGWVFRDLVTIYHCDVYVGGKVRVSELMISLDLRLCGSK